LWIESKAYENEDERAREEATKHMKEAEEGC
jgi:uncharacterized protein YbjQ (UPF0145 family)